MAASLREIQDAFQAALLNGDDSILATLCDSSRASRTALFGVYRNAYVGRLVDILRNEYAMLAAYMGKEDFDTMARAYVAAHPSRTQNARWVGAHLPHFLDAAETYAPHAALGDLAAIEMALSDAFDAEDAPALSEADLGGIDPQVWGRLAFEPHPSTRAFAVRTNAFAIWRAVREEAPAPEVEEAGEGRQLFVWREGAMPKVRVLDDEAWMVWQETVRGATFGDLCALLAFSGDAETAAFRAAQHLKSWLSIGALAGVSVAEPA